MQDNGFFLVVFAKTTNYTLHAYNLLFFIILLPNHMVLKSFFILQVSFYFLILSFICYIYFSFSDSCILILILDAQSGA